MGKYGSGNNTSYRNHLLNRVHLPSSAAQLRKWYLFPLCKGFYSPYQYDIDFLARSFFSKQAWWPSSPLKQLFLPESGNAQNFLKGHWNINKGILAWTIAFGIYSLFWTFWPLDNGWGWKSFIELLLQNSKQATWTDCDASEMYCKAVQQMLSSIRNQMTIARQYRDYGQNPE